MPKTHKGKKVKGRKRCNDEPVAVVHRRDARKLQARPLPKEKINRKKEEKKLKNKPSKKAESVQRHVG